MVIPLLVELQSKLIIAAYKSKGISLSHTPYFICHHRPALQHPHVSSFPCLGLNSEWVTPLFTIFQIPSQVFGLAGCLAFSPAITGLRGFSNGAFEEITLFSPSSREKQRHLASDLYSQSHRPSSSPVWRIWLLKYPHTLCAHVESYKRTHRLFSAQFRVSQRFFVNDTTVMVYDNVMHNCKWF